jgi:hypothetical protein
MSISDLHLFSAGSENDGAYQNLWIKGASLFIPQINRLIDHTPYNFTILDIQDFQNDCETLGNALQKNGSDKSAHHNYHILYSHILNILGTNHPLQLLEIGLGTNNPTLISTMGSNARPGASLYGFRDYLPNANIYGADIDRAILFESDRIKTSFVDQLDMNTFDELSQNFGNIKYDLIIDDGLHSIGANFNTLLFGLNQLNDHGWIVIEDIHIVDNWKSIDFILSSTNQYKTYIIKARNSYMYAVNKL